MLTSQRVDADLERLLGKDASAESCHKRARLTTDAPTNGTRHHEPMIKQEHGVDLSKMAPFSSYTSSPRQPELRYSAVRQTYTDSARGGFAIHHSRYKSESPHKTAKLGPHPVTNGSRSAPKGPSLRYDDSQSGPHERRDLIEDACPYELKTMPCPLQNRCPKKMVCMVFVYLTH